MGSIRRVQRRQKGTGWRVQYRTADGDQRSATFDLKRDAERFLSERDAQIRTGTYIDPHRTRTNVREWTEQWLASLGHVKATTLERYTSVAYKHVLPRWGDHNLDKLSHLAVSTWLTELHAGGQSAASIQKIHRVLSLILDSAVREGRLPRNVAQGIQLPRVARKEHPYLTHAQVDDLAHECGFPSTVSKHRPPAERENETNRLVVLFLAYTGVRWGEMAALTVRNLNLETRRATIATSVTPVQGKGLVWSTPKSGKRRDVPIPRFLAEDLRRHIASKHPDEIVFTGVRGGAVMRVATFRRPFDAAAEAIGVPGLRIHDLRHTAASLAIASGAEVKVVQQMLGHTSATMTLDLYGHLYPDRLNEVSDAMEAARATQIRRPEQERTGIRTPPSRQPDIGR